MLGDRKKIWKPFYFVLNGTEKYLYYIENDKVRNYNLVSLNFRMNKVGKNGCGIIILKNMVNSHYMCSGSICYRKVFLSYKII